MHNQIQYPAERRSKKIQVHQSIIHSYKFAEVFSS